MTLREMIGNALGTKHLDACMMMNAYGGCQVAADVPGAGIDTWAELKAHEYAKGCDTSLDGEKGYRIADLGRAAYKVEMAA